MNKSKCFPVLIVLIILALSLSACSNQSQDDIEVSVQDEFKFNPATINVGAGQDVNITFNNTGSVEHSLNILKAGEELEHVVEDVGDEEHLHEALLFDIHETAPGESVSETFTAPTEAGEYTIACLVPGHVEAGMVGTLQVAP